MSSFRYNNVYIKDYNYQKMYIILKKYATTGDGILTAIMLAEEMCDRKMSLGKLAEPLMKKLKDTTKRWKQETGLGFALYGTPAESLCYKFAKIDRERFGTIKDIINNESVSVTVFNGGEDAFACFISGRDENWATLDSTEQIYIESGESETLVLENYDEACSKFMLEFRELYEGATVYLRGKDTDYSKIQKLRLKMIKR